MSDNIQIAAVGKTISNQNGIKLMGAIAYLVDVAANSGLLSADDLNMLFSTVMKPGIQNPIGEGDNEPSGDLSGDLETVQASSGSNCCLLTIITKRTWRNNLSTALDTFKMRSRDVLFMSDDQFGRAKFPQDRAKTLAVFVDDIASYLKTAFSDYKPEYRDSDAAGEMGFPMPMYMSALSGGELQAGRFTDSIERRTWSSRLDSTIDIFTSYFCDLVKMSDAAILEMYQVSDRSSAVTKIIDELKTALIEIVTSFPLSLRMPNDGEFGKKVMQLSAEDEDTEELVWEVGLQLGAADPAELNRRPMSGMLFPIDTPSEATPAVGPGLPLLIPREVALSLVGRVQGLPLDADDSLTKHANKQIVGVINCASIEGDEFRIDGCLFDWSQPELVSRISANKRDLGMSMNAMAKGRTCEVNGRKVFRVDSLELMGANILRRSKATFTGTNLISAASLEPEPEELIDEPSAEIDFSAPDFDTIVGQLDKLLVEPSDIDLFAIETTEEDDNFSDEDIVLNLEQQIEDEDLQKDLPESIDLNTEIQLSQTPMTDLEQVRAEIAAFAATVNDTLAQTVQAVGVLAEDYQQRQHQAEIQAAQQQQQDALYAADSISELTIAKLKEMGLIGQAQVTQAAATPDPYTVPARRTIAISAAAAPAPGATDSTPLLLQLANINGQMDILDLQPGSGEQMASLIQKAQALRAQIAQL